MIVWCCVYSSYVDKKVTVLELGKVQGGKSDKSVQDCFAKIIRMLCLVKKRMLNKDETCDHYAPIRDYGSRQTKKEITC